MAARDLEALQLTRCVLAARDATSAALDQREANVFSLAAAVLESRFPRESMQLERASELYFSVHPEQRVTPQEIVRVGWVSSLPRLRDMLSRQFLQQ